VVNVLGVVCEIIFGIDIWWRRKFRRGNPEHAIAVKIAIVLGVVASINYILTIVAILLDS
jgi:uncharacterized iron-regulated membrane protein